jgi:protein O-GlcNAc transferase
MMRKPRLAEEHLRAALKLVPQDAMAAANLAHVLLEQGRTTEAETLARGITDRNPRSAEGHHMLGFALTYQGEVEAALVEFREAHRLAPDSAAVISNALFASLYSDARDADAVLALHRELAPKIMPARAPMTAWRNDRDPARRLKIGYLSPDLRSHPVSMFLEPIVEHHDRNAFEVICYSTTSAPDATTQRLQSHAALWHDCSGWSGERVAALIEADGVDILVDLAGHTAQNSASVLRAKPAPVQALYIGYPGSTGLPEMDWLIADAHLCPPGSERYCSEKVVLVGDSYWCYQPPRSAPDPGPLPAATNGYVTFGSYNAYQKVTDATVALWAGVLRAVPRSRLAIKALAFTDENVRNAAQRRFVAAGIEAARILTLPPTDPSVYLQEYHRLDIALDSSPYNGATTSCEALWMGVPVISLVGDRFCGRMGLSLLENMNMPELAARSPEEFSRIAASLAGDLPRLESLRRELRARMAASRICDGPRAAKALEKAFRGMWLAWTGSG